MKRFLVFALVIGVLAGQASAMMYELDIPTARQFTQLPNPIAPGTSPNILNYVIDNPGTSGSTTYYNDLLFGATPSYGYTMQYDVGFVGQLVMGSVLDIGLANPGISAADFDSFGAYIANDNQDVYRYHLFVSYDNLSSKTTSSEVVLSPGENAFLTIPTVDFGSVTHIGFDIEIVEGNPVDNFHTSLVPVPAAMLLGVLGLGTAGLRLRKRK